MNSKEVSELFNLSIDTLRYYEKQVSFRQLLEVKMAIVIIKFVI